MDEHTRHKRHLLGFFATAGAVALLAALLNYGIDPYALFGTPRKAGINERKPALSERVRVAKPYMVERVKPATVIGGNSRPEMGLDPRSACWNAGELPVFNAAIPGAGFSLQIEYLKHAVEQGDARQVLLGLDFRDFLIDSRWTTRDEARERSEEETRLSPREDSGFDFQHLSRRVADRLAGLFSLVALNDSLATLLAQGDPHAATRTVLGFNPGLDYRTIIRAEGQAVLFAQKNREVRDALSPPELGLFDAGGERSPRLKALRDFLAWAQARGIEVALFINPYHVDYLALIDVTGRWPQFEAWKRELLAIADAHSVALWDFNGIDEYSTESPPPPGDRRGELRWYWEPAHYKRELGEHMLAAMLARDCGPAGTHRPFGARLAAATLDAHLAGLAQALRAHAAKATNAADAGR